MPLYKIKTKGSSKLRLVDATSEAAALKHAAASMFTAERVTKPTDAAAMMAGGVKLETAGEPVPLDLGDKAGIVAAAEAVVAEAGETKLTLDGLFAKLVAGKQLPDTPEARAAFDSTVKGSMYESLAATSK